MNPKKLAINLVAVVMFGAASQVFAAVDTSDFVSVIPDHLSEASFYEQVRHGARVSWRAAGHHSPRPGVAAKADTFAAIQAAFTEGGNYPASGAWLSHPPVSRTRTLTICGAGLLIAGMLTRYKMRNQG